VAQPPISTLLVSKNSTAATPLGVLNYFLD
jgi:hypothetical protein